MSSVDDARAELTRTTVAEFRRRLLDLSNRNRLLNYRHQASARQVRIVDNALGSLFELFQAAEKAVPIVGLPKDRWRGDDAVLEAAVAKAMLTNQEYRQAVDQIDPDAENDEVLDAAMARLRAQVRAELGLPPAERRHTVEQVAQDLGISTSYELELESQGAVCSSVQTLRFEDDMARKVSAIREEAVLSLQERGVNTLHCAIGFLEWYESDSSKKALLSPLLLVPIEITRDIKYGNYVYTAKGLGDESEVNVTLAERLAADFPLVLPPFDPESTIVDYLGLVEQAIAGYPRWQIRPYATIGLFDFTRLAMYKDLDPRKRSAGTELDQHPVVLDLLGGMMDKPDVGGASPGIDEDPHHAQAPMLVTDADSSQFAVIRHALEGNSFVCEGPPGTGKSQTITNIIAAAIAAGKRVLFVAEKRAALEVVKTRLDGVGLGEFCFELHSTKLKKSDVYASLQKRLSLTCGHPSNVAGVLGEIRTARERIQAYCEALHTTVGAQEKTVFELIWREQLLRSALGEAIHHLQTVPLAAPMEIDQPRLSTLQSLMRNTVERERAYAISHGNVSLHPLAPITLTGMSQDEIAQLQAVLQDLKAASLEVSRLVTLLRIVAPGESLTVELLQEVLETFREIAAMSVVPSPADLEVARTFSDPEEILTLGGRVASALRVRSRWHQASYLAAIRKPALLEALTLSCRRQRLSTRGSLDERLSELQRMLEARMRARECLQRVAAVIPVSGDRFVLRVVLPMMEVLTQIDGAALSGYRGPLIEAPELALVDEAELEALRITSALGGEAKRFDLSLAGSPKALRLSASALRQSGILSRWFSSEVKEAVRHYRRIALQQAGASHQMMATDFTNLAALLEQAAAFDTNARYAAAFGGAFAGRESEFRLLRQASRAAAIIRAALPDAGSWSTDLRARLAKLDVAGWSRLREAACSTAFPLLWAFVRDEQAEPSLDAECERLERQIQDAKELVTLWDSFTPPPNYTVNELTDLYRAVVLERHVSDALGAHPVASTYFGEWGSVDRLEAKLMAVRYWQILRARRVEEVVLRADPFVFLSRRDAPEIEELHALDHAIQEGVARLRRLAGIDAHALFQGRPADAEFATMAQVASGMVNALIDLPEWLQYRRATQTLSEHRLEAVVALCHQYEIDPGDALEYCVTRALTMSVFADHPTLADVVGRDLADARARFAASDRSFLELTARQVRHILLNRQLDSGSRVGARSTWTGLALIELEAKKMRRHAPLRALFRRSGKALQEMKPCFMMSPLSVAQYIVPGELSFDLLVIDEASQMRPEDAIGAVSRAKQLIVVGDSKQLPPTSFFDRAEAQDELPDEDALDVESILDLAQQQFGRPHRLLWHYRSLHDSLIAFSNEHFYDRELHIVPSPDQSGGVRRPLHACQRGLSIAGKSH